MVSAGVATTARAFLTVWHLSGQLKSAQPSAKEHADRVTDAPRSKLWHTQIRVILSGAGLGETKKFLVLFLIYVSSDAKLLSFITSTGLNDQSVEILETISNSRKLVSPSSGN